MEHTFLLHTRAPGETSKILYWYRTAPGLRIGRPALDDAVMRGLEEQYPEIDFDWDYILDVGAMTPVEIEAPLPPRKRKPPPPVKATAEDDDAPRDVAPARDDDATAPAGPALSGAVEPAEAPGAGPDLLSDLLGRGIAASLRARHAELEELASRTAGDPAAWSKRLAVLDPDGWHTPEAVLAGMAAVERGVDELRAELTAADPDA